MSIVHLAGKFVYLKPQYTRWKKYFSIREPGLKTDEVVNLYAAKGKFLFSTSSWFLNANLTLNANSPLNDNLSPSQRREAPLGEGY